jgi:glycosyltransferase involved in cell wall biosynthesis
MKVGLYNPHLATLGGGENLQAVMADVLANVMGAQVDLLAHEDEGVDQTHLSERFGVDLTRVGLRFVPRHTQPLPGARQLSLFAHNRALSNLTREYDLFISTAISSYVPSRARRSIYLCMFPLSPGHTWRGLPRSLYFRHVISTYTRVVTISKFVETWMQRYWQVESSLLYPPVDVSDQPRLDDKRQRILSVGRFYAGRHNKKHRPMIEAFIRLVDQGLTGWEYHLVGGVTDAPGTHDYIADLQQLIAGYPIRLHFNATAADLGALRAQSRIFWHATGFGENQQAHPEKMEHFGISTVEAMNAGLVPVVFGQGGQPEVVTHGENGFLWHTLDELVMRTRELILDPDMAAGLAARAHARSLHFGRDVFAAELRRLVDEVMRP